MSQLTEEEIKAMQSVVIKENEDEDNEKEEIETEDTEEIEDKKDDDREKENNNEDNDEPKDDDELTWYDLVEKDIEIPTKFRGKERYLPISEAQKWIQMGYLAQEAREELNKHKPYLKIIKEYDITPEQVKALADLKSGREEALEYLQRLLDKEEEDKPYEPKVEFDNKATVDDVVENDELKNIVKNQSEKVQNFFIKQINDGQFIGQAIETDFLKAKDIVSKVLENLEYANMLRGYEPMEKTYLYLFDSFASNVKEKNNKQKEKNKSQKQKEVEEMSEEERIRKLEELVAQNKI